jgi:hypothetical protein
MAYLIIVWPYLWKMLLFKENLPVLKDNMAVFKEILVCKDNIAVLAKFSHI